MIIGKAISPFALRKKNGGVPTDADAQAFITATGISGTNATATNQLVIDLKTANIWTKMKAVYPMVGGTATTCKFNLKDSRDLDAAYRLTFFGGGTFSSNGYQPNGTNSYGNTFLIPSANFNNTTFNHLSYYSRTNSAVAFEYAMGSSAIGAMSMIIRRDTNAGFGFSDYASGITYRGASGSVTNSLGLFTFSQKGTTAKLFKNNTTVASNSYAPASLPLSTNAIILGAVNETASVNGYTNKQCAFSSIGEGLTDAEALALYNAVQLFQTTLGRQV